MNKERRKELGRAITLLNDAQEKLELAKEAVEGVKDGEEEAHGNLPESLQESDRGEAMQENIDNLDNIISELDDVYDNVEEQIDEIKNVIDQ